MYLQRSLASQPGLLMSLVSTRDHVSNTEVENARGRPLTLSSDLQNHKRVHLHIHVHKQIKFSPFLMHQGQLPPSRQT